MNFQVIWLVFVHSLKLPARQAYATVASFPLSLFQHSERTVYTYEIGAICLKCITTGFEPRVLLKHVIHHDGKAVRCQDRQDCMEI